MDAYQENIRGMAEISARRRSNDPGPVNLAPIASHRIVVHASAATWSRCSVTDAPFLRRCGDIDLVPAGTHGGYLAESYCEVLEIWLAPRLFRRVARDLGRATARLEMRHAWKNESIVHLARALAIEQPTSVGADSLYAEAIGTALAARLLDGLSDVQRPKAGLSSQQMRRLLEYIEAHIDEPLTIARLAREAGASASHLRYWYKQATGNTLHRYIVQRRVERARLLLMEDGLTLSDVALAAGFSHPSHMARWMRRLLGVTPKSLR
jgi:AraC family transcriptional regulator